MLQPRSSPPDGPRLSGFPSVSCRWGGESRHGRCRSARRAVDRWWPSMGSATLEAPAVGVVSPATWSTEAPPQIYLAPRFFDPGLRAVRRRGGLREADWDLIRCLLNGPDQALHQGLRRLWGTIIEFRAGMISVSPIGRNCSQEEHDAF